MLLYCLDIVEGKQSVMIGDKIKYHDKYVIIHSINSVDFKRKQVTVRGYEVSK